MGDFDITRIPEHVLHGAIFELLGDKKLVKIKDGYKFRCPICGDSKKNPHLARGYILHKNEGWVYYCHNECGSMSLLNFIKRFNLNLYKRIIFQGFKNKRTKPIEIISEAEKTFDAADIYKFKKGELLDIYDPHPVAEEALKFCKERKIRRGAYSTFFVCVKSEKFFDKNPDGTFIYNDKGYPKGNEYGNRLIIPYYTYGGKWIQFDARSLEKDPFLRYRNLDDTDRELYNIDWLDTSKPFFLLEGSINATFIDNSVAFGGTKHLKSFLEQYPQLLENKENGVVIWDNDNPGYDEMPFTINLGFKWFNWSTIKPSEKYKFKEDGEPRIINDINDLVLYTDLVETDDEDFITLDSLKKYIENTDGAMIKISALYGNRRKKKKVRQEKIFKTLRNQTPEKETYYWEK